MFSLSFIIYLLFVLFLLLLCPRFFLDLLFVNLVCVFTPYICLLLSILCVCPTNRIVVVQWTVWLAVLLAFLLSVRFLFCSLWWLPKVFVDISFLWPVFCFFCLFGSVHYSHLYVKINPYIAWNIFILVWLVISL